MANKRKDSKGNILKKGECVRKSDGLYVYTFKDPLGKRQYIYANNIVELRNRETELFRDQLDGLDMYARGRATVNTTYDRYISTKNNLRDSTLYGYQYTYNHLVRDSFGMKLISEVKYSDVLQFYLYLLNEKGLKLGTLDSVHCVLHPTFELAVRDDIIRKNPTNGVMAEVVKSSGQSRGTRHALTRQQQSVFMDYIADHPVFCHWWPLFTVLLGTGARIGEAISLRWDDVDFEKGFIEINHAVSYYPTKGSKSPTLKVHFPKTAAGIRRIPMMDVVKEALLMAKEEQEEEGVEQPVLDGITGFVFLNRYGDVMNPQSVNRIIKRIVANYNYEEELDAAKEEREPFILPPFSCHILRHTFATRLCESCTNYKVIQSVMGHKQIETTLDIYADASDEKNKDVFEGLSVDFNDLF
jgi:integrase